MTILSKIKGFFFDVRKDVENKLEKRDAQSIINSSEKIEQTIPQPQGDLIGQCALCGMAIGSEDRIKDFNGEKVHKRCSKKMQKAFMNGESMKELTGGV